MSVNGINLRIGECEFLSRKILVMNHCKRQLEATNNGFYKQVMEFVENIPYYKETELILIALKQGDYLLGRLLLLLGYKLSDYRLLDNSLDDVKIMTFISNHRLLNNINHVIMNCENPECMEIFMSKQFVYDPNTIEIQLCKNVEVAQVLINHGVDPRVYSCVLHKCDSPEVLELLLKNGADPNHKDEIGQSPLHKCTCEDIAKILIKYGANIEARDKNGYTPFIVANNAGVAKVLYESGADINATSNDGSTAMHYVGDESPELAEYLISIGLDVNAKDNFGNTPIFTCFYQDVAEVFVEHGADLSIVNNNGETVLHHNMNDSCIEYLINSCEKLDINCTDNKGRTPIYCLETEEGIKAAITLGADINVKDLEGKTPLHLCDYEYTVSVLISNGADVEAVDNYGKTPLYYCTDATIAINLINAGADPDITHKSGKHLLEYLIENSYLTTKEEYELTNLAHNYLA